MAKILFFNFDGTDNEPADAMQERNFLDTTEDNSITNILKFHLLLGGNLREKTGNTLLPGGSCICECRCFNRSASRTKRFQRSLQ